MSPPVSRMTKVRPSRWRGIELSVQMANFGGVSLVCARACHAVLVRLASASTNKTFSPRRLSQCARWIAVTVLPTPPFLDAIAMYFILISFEGLWSYWTVIRWMSGNVWRISAGCLLGGLAKGVKGREGRRGEQLGGLARGRSARWN